MAKPGTDVILANHHTGPIVLARVYEVNTSGDPTKNKIRFPSRTIPAGEAGQDGKVGIPKEEWDFRKQNPVIKALFDRDCMTIVKKAGEVDFRSMSTSDLVVPPHLAAEEAEAESQTPKGGRVAAAVDRNRTKIASGGFNG